MHHFKLTFAYLGHRYSALVQKIPSHPVQFVVYNIHPLLTAMPFRLQFLSKPETDQLIISSCSKKQKEVLSTIGKELFQTCNLQKIPVHD